MPRPRTTHYVDRLANRLLAALMGAVSLMLLLGYLSNHFGLHGHPHFLALASPLPFSFGPLLYLYIAALTRQLPHFLRDAVAYGRFTWPVTVPDLGDFAIDGGVSATVVGGEPRKLEVLLGPELRKTSNDVFSATAIGLRSGMLAGYRSDVWGLMLELGYESVLATRLDHTALYRQTGYAGAKDGWYAITGGTLLAATLGVSYAF